MGINIGTKLFPVGVLCCEGWRWYAGKDVRVDSGYNRRMVGPQNIWTSLDRYVTASILRPGPYIKPCLAHDAVRVENRILWRISRMSDPLRMILFFYHGATAPSGPRSPHYGRFMITLRYTTLGRTPLDESWARRRDLYLTTHNIHKRQTSMPPAGFEPTSQQASGRRPTPRPRGNWDQLMTSLQKLN